MKRRPTKPVEALPLVRSAQCGDHPHLLLDELNDACQKARRANRRRIEDMPTLPDGARDARIQADDPVVIPYWAFLAVYELAMKAVVDGQRGTGRHARARERYRADQIHWHRYMLVKKAFDQGGKWPPGQPDAFAQVSKQLRGTAFAAQPDGIKKSYLLVKAALARGEDVRFYRSTSDHLYEFLLNTPGPTFFKA